MKILICSDTHRYDKNLQNVIEEQKPFDMLIHLGDAEGSDEQIAEWLDDGCELVMVKGNNDFFSPLEPEIELRVGPHRIFLTHGHHYNVSLGVDHLREEALDRRCDMAFYGHTHRPYLEYGNQVLILNPGSLSYPRQEGRRPSYMILEFDKAWVAHVHTYYL